jgi:predicted N-formylglutamate amidohydrolase
MDQRAAHMDVMSYQLLAEDEPSAVYERNRNGRSTYVITVDHASRRIPKRLGNLGLPASELARHVAWDIGALEVAQRRAAGLDAPLLAPQYSRRVIDCNREPGVESSIPTMAESVAVAGNINLADEEIAARQREIFEPYHARLRSLLDERLAVRHLTMLVALHTMTDVFKGVHRQMHASVLYDRDRRLAGPVLKILRQDKEVIVADNEPYSVVPGAHYTIPRHAAARDLPYVSLEIRQDLVADEVGQELWAQRISRALDGAERTLQSATASKE